MNDYQVIFYEKENGSHPAEDFINSLDDKMSSKLYGLLAMMSKNGASIREPFSKHLDDGIFELRVRFNTNAVRILYFFFSGGKIIVTNGFVKKTQKTPKSEIRKAKTYRNNYIEREVRNNENS